MIVKFVSSSLRNHVIIILKLNCSGIYSKPQAILWVRNGGRTPRYMQLIECYRDNQIQDNMVNWTWVYKILIVKFWEVITQQQRVGWKLILFWYLWERTAELQNCRNADSSLQLFSQTAIYNTHTNIFQWSIN